MCWKQCYGDDGREKCNKNLSGKFLQAHSEKERGL